MRIFKSDTLTESQKGQVFEMWNSEFPQSLRYDAISDFEYFLSKLGNIHYYFIEQDNRLIAWLATFDRDAERWFSMIIHNSCQKQGLGRKLLLAAKTDNMELNGWMVDNNSFQKESGEIYPSPIQFYLKNDFKLIADCRLELPMLSAVKIFWRKNRETY